jgi:hypothetical protein
MALRSPNDINDHLKDDGHPLAVAIDALNRELHLYGLQLDKFAFKPVAVADGGNCQKGEDGQWYCPLPGTG